MSYNPQKNKISNGGLKICEKRKIEGGRDILKKIMELNGECFLNQILPLPSGVPVPAGWSPCSTLPR